ncbi:MAG: polysaccharide pyruvyl transferase family protein [Pirellulaceae bacterium]|nr:polysaccharide pyruvyl transferase family protein [Pirellulaceae bacterium]
MNQRRPAVYFSLQTQFENLGDCIINELVLRELAKHAHVKIVQRRAPSWLLDRLNRVDGVEIFSSKARWFSDLFRRMVTRGPIVFAFKPGHYVCPSKVRGVAYNTAMVAFCGLCRAQGGSVIRSGVSLDRYGPLQSRLQSMLGRLHTSYGVRDQASLEYARQLGAVSAHYSPDMAFLLADARDTSGLDGARMITAEVSRPKLSLSFRAQGPMKDSAYLAQLVEATTRCASLNQLQPTVVAQVTYDQALAYELASSLNCDVVRFEQTEASVRGIFTNYSESRLVVSNRLHSLLFGWVAGAIPIPLIENHPHGKIVELFKHLGLSELIHFADDLTGLPAHIGKVVLEEPRRRKQLKKIFQDQRLILQEALASCFPKPA